QVDAVGRVEPARKALPQRVRIGAEPPAAGRPGLHEPQPPQGRSVVGVAFGHGDRGGHGGSKGTRASGPRAMGQGTGGDGPFGSFWPQRPIWPRLGREGAERGGAAVGDRGTRWATNALRGWR